MTTHTNPIDHAIVALLLTFEGICWIINELAGFHAEPEITDPRTTIAIEAPVAEVLDVTFDGGTHDLSWDEYVDYYAATDAYNALKRLTVKELRKQAQGLAKGIHMMRKDELVALLA